MRAVCLMVVGLMFFWSCQSKTVQALKEKHLVEMESADHSQSVSVDSLPVDKIMKVADTGQTTGYFAAYTVSINREPDSKPKMTKMDDKYFQYVMDKDWFAVTTRHDTLRPAFFYPVVKTLSQKNEAVLVFEVAKPDSVTGLLFNDPDQTWSGRIFKVR